MLTQYSHRESSDIPVNANIHQYTTIDPSSQRFGIHIWISKYSKKLIEISSTGSFPTAHVLVLRGASTQCPQLGEAWYHNPWTILDLHILDGVVVLYMAYIYICHIYGNVGLFTMQFLGTGTHFRMCLCLRSFAASLTKIVAEKRPGKGYPLPHSIPSSPILAPYVHGMCMGMCQKQLYHLLRGWTSMNNSYFDATVPGFRPIQ